MEKSITSVVVAEIAGGGRRCRGDVAFKPFDDEEEWEVEEIVDSRCHRGRIQYRVKWTGFHDPDTTWYPADNFRNSPDAVTQFHGRYPNKPASQF
jgi:hypothetical protein